MTAAFSGPVLLAAGGTGGHVFPAEALAGELAARGIDFALVTDARGRTWQGPLARKPIHYVRAASPSGGWRQRLAGATALAAGFLAALGVVARTRPGAVVGFGGYASVPTVLAARLRGVPSLIHEQNAVLGRANRLLAGGAAVIATAFAAVRFLRPDDRRVILVGNPVREAVGRIRSQEYQPPQPGQRLRLVVIGGSQGAAVFSKVVPQAVRLLPAALRQRLTLVQQCRAEDIEAVRALYLASEVEAELATFFDDFPARLAQAHLLITRSGASTVAELATAGRPAILVPFPFATDDHQSANAAALAKIGGALAIAQENFTAETLASHMRALFEAPTQLAAMAAAARGAGYPDAARRLADLVESLGQTLAKTGRRA